MSFNGVFLFYFLFYFILFFFFFFFFFFVFCSFLFFSSGGHFVQPSGTILTVLVKGHKRKTSLKSL